ncbi:MAG: M20/M25/M40 family metallo-hydrolase [Acidobacteriota bacterium]|nr:M20/M25/M40 family metallo-hydrolase [Acidobacteriota bacterium]
MIFRLACFVFVAHSIAPAQTAQQIGSYRGTADKLIDAALKDDAGLKRLEYLCYQIGNRLSGSKTLEQAIAWSAEEMQQAGLANVRTIPVKVPHWVRGAESAQMVAPFEKPLFMLGLGNSIGTPRGGITADVAAVSTFAELEKLGAGAVKGRIVLFDAPFVDYENTVAYRSSGASRAARLGAVAVLVRSVTGRSLRDPHTGAVGYGAQDPKIPAAAVSVEDAAWIHRLIAAGRPVRVRLEMEAHSEPDADSADVMGELTGRDKPEEVVVIGGHIDSWDVGQGAHDDGSGVIAALQALVLMKQLGLQPRRTIRVVFWTSEENSGSGGRAYREWASHQPGRHVAAIEMDGGAEKPIGFEIAQNERPRGRGGPVSSAVPADFEPRARAIGALLKRIHADQIVPGSSEADVEPLFETGVPALGLRTVMTHYFDYHHTQADTFDKIVPDEFRRCVAAFAVMSYVLADWN